MDFFQQLTAIGFVGTLRLAITPADDHLTVSVLVDNPACGDSAKYQIIPLNLKGTAEEFDLGFFDQITKPVQTMSGLQVDLEAHQRSIDAAKKASASASKTAGVPAAPVVVVDKKAEKYKTMMAEVVKLRDEKRYLEAIKKLPEVKEYPVRKEMIEGCRKWLAQAELDKGAMFLIEPKPWPADTITPIDEPTVTSPSDDDEEDERENEQLDSEYVTDKTDDDDATSDDDAPTIRGED